MGGAHSKTELTPTHIISRTCTLSKFHLRVMLKVCFLRLINDVAATCLMENIIMQKMISIPSRKCILLIVFVYKRVNYKLYLNAIAADVGEFYLVGPLKGLVLAFRSLPEPQADQRLLGPVFQLIHVYLSSPHFPTS